MSGSTGRGPGRRWPDGLRVAVLSRSVFPLHGFGGLERHVFDLVRHLARLGVRVTLIVRTPRRSAGPSATPIDPGVEMRFVPYTTFPLAGRRGTTIVDRSTAYPLFGQRAGRVAARLAATEEVDIVHGLGAACLGYARARRGHRPPAAPLVFNPQGLEEFGGFDGSYGGARLKGVGYAPLRRAVRICADAADVVLATDRAIEPAITRHLGVGPDRMRLVPNAIDVEVCDAMAPAGDGHRVRAAAGIEDGVPLLLSAGRLERNKGFHVLVEALASLRDLDWRWVLVGDGPFRRAIEDHLARAGLAGRVRLAGRVDDRDLHAWYDAADLFVHPTLYEGSSLVTLEAMAHRRAVVATRAGGLPDKVHHGSTGWLVEPGDAGALAASLRQALSAGSRIAAMGLAGRRLLEAEFSWTSVAHRLIDVYQELLEGGLPS